MVRPSDATRIDAADVYKGAATPIYDIVSTLPYPLRQHMAMDMDGSDSNFRQSYFVTFGERISSMRNR